MALLTSADYPAIRAALDVALDSTILPDATIALDIYLGAAEREVAALDPDSGTRTGDDLARVKSAVVYLTAALLAPAIPWIVRESVGGQSYERVREDWGALASALRQRAHAEIATVLDPTQVTPTRPAVFALAAGRRGR